MSTSRALFFVVILVKGIALGADMPADSSASDPSLIRILKEDALQGVDDAGFVFGSPFRFDKADWITTGIITGATATMFLADESVRTFAARQHGNTQDHFMKVGKLYGEWQPAAIVGGGLYLGGLVFKDPYVRVTGRMFVESFVLSGVVESLLKTVIGRSRPYTEEGAHRFRGFQFHAATTALPSGHTTVAFAMSTVLAERIDNRWATAGLYGLAGLTAVSRVYDDDHWLSDVFLGSVVGIVVAKAVVANNRESDRAHTTWHLFPTRQGIMLSVNF